MQPGDTEEDRKIVIYHEEWCSLNVEGKEVVQPFDMTARIVPEEALFPEGQESLQPGQELVIVKNQQLWITNAEGELGELVVDQVLVRKLTESETQVVTGGLLVNGLPTKEVLNIFDSGKYKEHGAD